MLRQLCHRAADRRPAACRAMWLLSWCCGRSIMARDGRLYRSEKPVSRVANFQHDEIADLAPSTMRMGADPHIWRDYVPFRRELDRVSDWGPARLGY